MSGDPPKARRPSLSRSISENIHYPRTRTSKAAWLCVLTVLFGLGISYFAKSQADCGDHADGIDQSTQADQSPAKTIYDLTYWPDIPNADKNRTKIGTEDAVIYMLCRNWELHEALESMRQVEDRFNRRYRYPWVFLNDEEFTEEFKSLTSGLASGEASYGLVPKDVWNVPAHIDQEKMHECIEDFKAREIIYGESISYRNMCRFNSGNFFWHELMMPYKWYWRVEPGVKFFCDQLYDPFTFLRENNKVYGFVITINEYIETIPTLWATFKEFMAKFPQHIAKDNGLSFLTDMRKLRSSDMMPDEGEYNLCHFWSNFEIGSLDFFRSQAYTDYFNYLNDAGGFYYERWGDAPVHSIGLLALANKTQIHHFSDIGYYHNPLHRCPHDDAAFVSGRCICPLNKNEEIDFQPFSCLARWWHHAGRQFLFNFTAEHSLPEQ